MRQLLKHLAADIWRKGGWCKGPLVPLGPGSLGLSPAFSVECSDKKKQRKIFARRSLRILIEFETYTNFISSEGERLFGKDRGPLLRLSRVSTSLRLIKLDRFD